MPLSIKSRENFRFKAPSAKSVKGSQITKKRPLDPHLGSISTKKEQQSPLKIIVADDDSTVIDLFQQVLSNKNPNPISRLEAEKFEDKHSICQTSLSFKLETFRQGDEALNAVRQSIEEGRPFSVAFLDIRMPPGPDGIWTAENIRLLDPNIEIVIITGYKDVNPIDITRRVPPAHKLLYLQKPFHIQEIFQMASGLSMKWRTESESQKLYKEIENRVDERTEKLKKVNERLRLEIVERQYAQEELKKSECKLNAIFNSIADRVSMIDGDLNIIWANKTCKKLFGNSIVGEKCYKAYRGRKEPCEPYPCYILKTFMDGKSHQCETQVIEGDGEILSFHCIANVASRDKDGKPLTVVEVSRDITKQKKIEEALLNSKERFRKIFEDSPISLWEEDFSEVKRYVDRLKSSGVKDFRTYFKNHPGEIAHCARMVKVLSVNKFTLDLYQAENKEKLLNSLEKVFTEESYNLFRDQVVAISEGREKFKGESINKTLKGETKNIRLKWSVVPGHEKTFSKILVSIIDITDLKRNEELLRKAHDELELRIKERTRELDEVIKIMKQNEKELMEHRSSLEKVNRELLETNQALSVLARNIDRDREALEKRIFKITSSKIIPVVKELQRDTRCQKRSVDLELISTYLKQLSTNSSLHREIDSSLTEQEMRVAVLIKNGLTSQKIADMLYISLHTVKTHRRNIRKKLKIQNFNINLPSYLRSVFKDDR